MLFKGLSAQGKTLTQPFYLMRGQHAGKYLLASIGCGSRDFSSVFKGDYFKKTKQDEVPEVVLPEDMDAMESNPASFVDDQVSKIPSSLKLK